MKLAVNYSLQAADLLRQGRIDFDLYKCPDWPDVVADAVKQRPVYIHFPLMAGYPYGDSPDWEAIPSWLEQMGTPFVNAHLGVYAPEFDGMPLDTTNPHHRELVIERINRDVRDLIQRFGAERVILENVPWDPAYQIARPAIEPEVISQIVYESGCGLLLDVSHARLAARHLGMDEREYLLALPVDRIREMHVTGIGYDQEGNLSDHLAMTEDDWTLQAWVMEHIASGKWAAPWVVALEYGGVGPQFEWRSNPEVLAVDVPRLYEMVHTVKV